MRIRHGCGMELNVPDELAGKRVRCPRCGQEFTAPLPGEQGPSATVAGPAPADSEVPAKGMPSQCPGCGRALAADTVICVACGFNVKTGERLTTVASGASGRNEPAAGAMPSRAKVIAVAVCSAGIVLAVIVAVVAWPGDRHGRGLDPEAARLARRIATSKSGRPSALIGYHDFDMDAFRGLIRLGPKAVPALIGVYRDPSVSDFVRVCVIDALKGIGDPSAVPFLVDVVTKNESCVPSAIQALSEIGDEKVLKTILDSAPHHWGRALTAVHRLIERKIIVPSTCGIFLKGLDDGRGDVVMTSICVFTRVRHEDSVPILLSLLKRGPPDAHLGFEHRANFKNQIARAFGCQGDMAAVPALIGIRRTVDPSLHPVVHVHAKEAMCRITGTVFENLKEWEEWQGKNKGKSREEVLLGNLKSTDGETRRWSALSLAESGNNEGMDVLIDGLTHPDSHIRFKMAKVLGKTKDKSAIPALRKRLLEEKGAVRRSIEEALEELGD